MKVRYQVMIGVVGAILLGMLIGYVNARWF